MSLSYSRSLLRYISLFDGFFVSDCRFFLVPQYFSNSKRDLCKPPSALLTRSGTSSSLSQQCICVCTSPSLTVLHHVRLLVTRKILLILAHSYSAFRHNSITTFDHVRTFPLTPVHHSLFELTTQTPSFPCTIILPPSSSSCCTVTVDRILTVSNFLITCSLQPAALTPHSLSGSSFRTQYAFYAVVLHLC